LFRWGGINIGHLQTVADRAPTPVATAKAIQALDQPHPTEIVTARAIGAGALTLTILELWAGPVWQQLATFTGANNILDIFNIQAGLNTPISCMKVIVKPDNTQRVKTYNNCMITDVDDTETVQIGTLEFAKSITIQYTHATWS
jgi:hypothetical protein